MKRNHPKLHQVTTLAALVTLASAAGCQSQPTAFTNPFLAPDRVPPPATRTLLPGQAAPYYPGDPLPAMQSSSAGATPAGALAANISTPQRSTTKATSTSRPSPTPSNEPAVAIPSDNDSLRFALPKPLTAPTPSPPAPQSAGQIAHAPSKPPVSPASYNQPLPANPPAMNGQPPFASGMGQSMAASTGPWRSPQIARQNIATPQHMGIAPQPLGQPLAAMPPNYIAAPSRATAAPPPGMAVRLRAVPSPPPPPADATTPRIRLPGYATTQPVSAQPGAVEQAANYPWTNGAMQTVQITPLAANMVAPTVATLSTGDGFRPRGSMR